MEDTSLIDKGKWRIEMIDNLDFIGLLLMVIHKSFLFRDKRATLQIINIDKTLLR